MYYDAGNFNETSLGKIKVSSHVIEVITRASTLEVEGVVSLNSTFEFADIINRNKTIAKGIKVNFEEKQTIIDVSVVIKSGLKLLKLAEQIQENVKYSIETMTGLDVAEVNVHIDGIEI